MHQNDYAPTEQELAEIEASAPPKLELTNEQKTAVARIRAWFGEISGPGEMSMGGFAGSGKTTVISELPMMLGFEPDVLAPTGKATQVLNRKGIAAETVHSYLYDFRGKTKFEDNRGDRRTVMNFDAKEQRMGESDLVIIDESSMVNQQMANDIRDTVIRSGRAKVLWVGDHGQLEPVGKNPGIMDRPDIVLNTIMRQAQGNPIIAFAHAVRTQGAHPSNYLNLADGERLKIGGKTPTPRLCEYADENGIDQIIVPFHRIRHSINKEMRRRRGFSKVTLAKGEKVVVKLNNRKQHLCNGMQFEVITDPTPDFGFNQQMGKEMKFRASIKSLDDGRVWEDMNLFLPDPDGDAYDECFKQDNVAIDYAYAITCHVAQGSEWDKVLVAYAPCRAWNDERWLYTAATRAAEHLTVVRA